MSLLARGGMSERDEESTLEGITPEIREKLPKGTIEAVTAGEFPPGFGLMGPVGSGKSGTLAALMIACAHAQYAQGLLQTKLESSPYGGYIYPPIVFRWCSWPETVNRFRVMSAKNGGVDDVAALVDEIADAPMLVLDDLGSERIRGEYTDDWATTQLDLIIDRRYNARLATWYTTSLEMDDLIRRYGRRMLERLWNENPLIQVGNLLSRRIGVVP